MKRHTSWFMTIALVLCGCAEEKSEVIDQQALASPGGVFAPLPPAVQNPLSPKAGVGAMTADGVKLTIETSGMTYRIRISPGTNTVEYDRRSFQPPSPGLCPGGAVAYLKTDKDALVGCNDGSRGYASSGMSSTVSFTNNYILLAGTNDFVSRPYEVSEILAGFNECAPAKAVRSIRKIQLGFSVDLRVNGVERGYVAKTEWSKISPDWIKALKW
jgi:hypothetical protein